MFDARNGAAIKALRIWDGPKNVFKAGGLSLSGNHSAGLDNQNSRVIDPLIEMKFGLLYFVLVQFDGGGPDMPSILFTSAGADCSQRRRVMELQIPSSVLAGALASERRAVEEASSAASAGPREPPLDGPVGARVRLRRVTTMKGPDAEVPLTSGWKRVKAMRGVSFSMPADMSPEGEQSVDSQVRSWAGGGVSVLLDFGPMSDRLDRHEGHEEVLSGRRARVVDFVDAGSHVFAAHLSDPTLTIAVRIQQPGHERVARAILKSLIIRE